ncbi:CoA transferase [Alloscardovia theropitheci]|uniref:CoA transferase n=1 Tax=Alloscardovia theropitheci TaxID=2496842 RepID=A0A4R0QRG2_9BIFI|nr:CoA transferase [Alloscardovia theropitheci]TCD53625.1 CoA transferase [Alloscardovia theropitheci]
MEKKEPAYAELESENNHLDKNKPYPLEGLLVVDLTRVLSGPTCARMLADGGARVIHVERKGKGDDTRSMGPYVEDGSSEYFRLANTGKESIALDFHDPEDFALLNRMIAKADIVVENFRPGVMKRLGIAPEDLCKKYPRLIVASISGFGQYGPMSSEPAYDTIVQAMSGIMDATGEPNGKATRVGTSISDIVAGMIAYAGIATALYAREHTGHGTTVDVAMLDATLSLMSQDLMTTLGEHKVPHRIGNRHPDIYPFDTFQCKDAPLAICCGNDHLWSVLSKALGHEEWANDPRFLTNDLREQNWREVKEAMESVLKTGTAKSWHKKIEEAGVPVGLVLNVDETRRLPQVIERGMVKTMSDGQEVMGTPMKYSYWNSYGVQKDAPAYNENDQSIRQEFA